MEEIGLPKRRGVRKFLPTGGAKAGFKASEVSKFQGKAVAGVFCL
jgi:hypothetical protein